MVVGLCLPSTPRYGPVKSSIDRALAEGVTLVLAPQSFYEAYVVLTRRAEANGYALTGAEVRDILRDLESSFSLLPDPSDLVRRWLDLCAIHDVGGKPAHDTRLAAWAKAHGVEAILTHNPGDFARYGLAVLS